MHHSRPVGQAFVLTLFAILCSFFQSQAQVRQISVSAGGQIQGSSFKGAVGYVATDRGVMFSTDSGYTFIDRSPTPQNVTYANGDQMDRYEFHPQGVHIVSSTEALVWGYYDDLFGTLLRTTNGGLNWKIHEIFGRSGDFDGRARGVEDIEFSSDGRYVYETNEFYLNRSSDGGLTWNPEAYQFNSSFFENIAFSLVGNNELYAIETHLIQNYIQHSVDGGEHWTNIVLPHHGQGEDIFFLTSQKGWISHSGRLYRTTNGGTSWDELNDWQRQPLHLTQIRFLDDSTGYAIKNQKMVRTLNGGVTWELVRTGPSIGNIYSYNLASPSLAWTHSGIVLGIMSNANSSESALPEPNFLVDTVGFFPSYQIRLQNQSRNAGSFQWYVNGRLHSTDFQATYLHDSTRVKDTIRLVMTLNGETKELTKIADYYLPLRITYFTPTFGKAGDPIFIYGLNFNGAAYVRFGDKLGIEITNNNNDRIRAFVPDSAGSVIHVTGPAGFTQISGFEYEAPLDTTLNPLWSDSILCFKEKTSLSFDTDRSTAYTLKDAEGNAYGTVTTGAAGIRSTINTDFISQTGLYYLHASRTRVSMTGIVARIFIRVEKPDAQFRALPLNAEPGQPILVSSNSPEGKYVQWTFAGDASTTTANTTEMRNLRYTSEGIKTATLIVRTDDNCRDTAFGNLVHIVRENSADETCYVTPVGNNNDFYSQYSHTLNNTYGLSPDGGYYLSGRAVDPVLPSRAGSPSPAFTGDLQYMAHYSRNGMLRWYMTLRGGGNLQASVTDQNGNLYVTGSALNTSYLRLPNGDSIRPGNPGTLQSAQIIYYAGFIVKLSPAGEYLWHNTYFNESEYDPTHINSFSLDPYSLAIRNNRLLLTGGIGTKVMMSRNGLISTIITVVPESVESKIPTVAMRLNLDGQLLNQVQFSKDPSNGYNLGYISTPPDEDSQGNLYVASQMKYRGVIVDNDGTINRVELDPAEEAVVMKFNAAGKYQWMHRLNTRYSGSTIPVDLKVNPADNHVYLSGMSSVNDPRAAIEFTDPDGTTHATTLEGMYLLKLNQAGQYQWAVGNYITWDGSSRSIEFRDNRVMVLGYARDPSNYRQAFTYVQPDSNHFVVPTTQSAFFVAEYNTNNGSMHRLYQSDHQPEQSVSTGHLMKLDANGNLLVWGVTDYNSLFSAPGGLFGIPYSRPKGGAFFAKLSPGLCLPNSAPVANAGQDLSVCAGGDLRVGGAPDDQLIYSWTSSHHKFVSNDAQPIVSPVMPTDYYLAVMNKDGVIAYDTMHVTTTGRAATVNAGPDRSLCIGQSVTLGTPALPGYTYEWSNINTGVFSNDAQPVVFPYDEQHYYLRVRTADNCGGFDTVILKAREDQQMMSEVIAEQEWGCVGSNNRFRVVVQNAPPVMHYEWWVNQVPTGTDSSLLVTNLLKEGNNEMIVRITGVGGCLQQPVIHGILDYYPAVLSNRPGISITGDTSVAIGGSSLLQVQLEDAGQFPTVQWQDSTSAIGWRDISLATSPSYNYIHEISTSIRCRLTTMVCSSEGGFTSNVLRFTRMPPPVDSTSPGAAVVTYPNPATDHITVDSLSVTWSNVHIEVLTSSGNPVVNSGNVTGQSNVTLDISRLTPGMYIIRVLADGEVKRRITFLKM